MFKSKVIILTEQVARMLEKEMCKEFWMETPKVWNRLKYLDLGTVWLLKLFLKK